MKNLMYSTAAVVALTMSASGALAQCSPDFSGIEITATTQTGPYIASALQLAADGWAEKLAVPSKLSSFPGRNCTLKS